MKKFFLLIVMLMGYISIDVYAQDILVKKDGTVLQVYNLDEGGSFYIYTLEPSADASIVKISKDEVFTIKKSDGTTVVPVAATPTSEPTQVKEPAVREPVTAKLSSEIQTIKGRKEFFAITPDSLQLRYAVLSETEHTLSVIESEYHAEKYIIPEYVKVNDQIYTVTEIGDKAFTRIAGRWSKDNYHIKEVQFPSTLKRIGERAFFFAYINPIILPEGLEHIGKEAFCGNCYLKHIKEIYIPSSVSFIGKNCFQSCGGELSPRNYCKAYFSNLPSIVSEEMCSWYGIDDSAVEAFYARQREKR